MKAFKPFEVPQRSVEIKIEVNFLSLFEDGTGRINIGLNQRTFRCFFSTNAPQIKGFSLDVFRFIKWVVSVC